MAEHAPQTIIVSQTNLPRPHPPGYVLSTVL